MQNFIVSQALLGFVSKELALFEIELFFTGIFVGIMLYAVIFPKLIIPKLKERWMQEDKPKKRYQHVLRNFDEPCPSCHSPTKHASWCPEHPKNKVKHE